MKHLPARVVLDARYYHRGGVTVAELARLFGVRRDTLSRAVNRATHAALVEPDGFRPRPLPIREPPPPQKRHAPDTPRTPEEVARDIEGIRVYLGKPKPAALRAAERAQRAAEAEREAEQRSRQESTARASKRRLERELYLATVVCFVLEDKRQERLAEERQRQQEAERQRLAVVAHAQALLDQSRIAPVVHLDTDNEERRLDMVAQHRAAAAAKAAEPAVEPARHGIWPFRR